MSKELVYEFATFSDAKAALKEIEQRFSHKDVTGLSYIRSGNRHIVIAVTESDEQTDREVEEVLAQRGCPSEKGLLYWVAEAPADVRLLGNAGFLIDFLPER